MTKVESIEREIRGFSDEELASFRQWFAEFDGVVWDVQIERDAREGKLDPLIDEAIKDHKSGNTTEL